MKRVLAVLIVMSVCICGCQPKTTNIDTRNDTGKPVLGLDYRDFDQAAAEMIQSLITSNTLQKPGGGRYVVATGRVVNDTMQRIDTIQLMSKVERELTRSGLVVMTSAVGADADQMVHETRELRDAEEFDPNTVAAKGTLIAPELSISGKIFQQNIKYDNNTQQVDYYFELKLTDVKTGLRFWQDEKVIGKRGSKKLTSW